MAVVGYWSFPEALREQVDRWPELSEQEAWIAEHDIERMVAVLTR
jgi:hypothetical protein